MYEHNALGYWSGLTLCLTKVRSSRACCPATYHKKTCFYASKNKTQISCVEIAVPFFCFKNRGIPAFKSYFSSFYDDTYCMELVAEPHSTTFRCGP